MRFSSELIPVLIVAGFLGSGKTTFIRESLPHLIKGGYHPFVILNDFLNASIDAFSLKDSGAEIKALASACVCCDDSESLLHTIKNISLDHHHLLIIEANGVSDPYRLIEILTLSPELKGIIGSLTQVTILNEARWGKRWLPGDKDLERAQVRTASAIICNRGDRASEKQRRKVLQDLESLNAKAIQLTAEQFFLKFLKISEGESFPETDLRDPISHQHLHVAVQLEPPTMDEISLRAWLRSLPSEILRIKGLVRISEEEMCYINRTDDAFESPRMIKVDYREDILPSVVFIAPQLDEAFLKNSFKEIPSAGAFKLR